MKMTACRIPFSAAVAVAEWDDFQTRFTNQTDCAECRQEFTQDTEDSRWYPSDVIEFGPEPRRADEVHPIQTQQGWFCSEDCHDEYLAKEAA